MENNKRNIPIVLINNKSEDVVDDVQQTVSLLKLPTDRDKRDVSVSSSISDIESPIYSSDTLSMRREDQVIFYLCIFLYHLLQLTLTIQQLQEDKDFLFG